MLKELSDRRILIVLDNFEWRGNIYRTMGDTAKAADCYAQAAAIYHKLNFAKKEEALLAALRDIQPYAPGAQ